MRILSGVILTLALLAIGVAPAQELAVVNATLHQYDGGPGIPSSFEYYPGDTIFVTFRVSGFETTEVDDEDRYQLQYTIKLEDPEGIELVRPAAGALAGVLTPQDKKQKWMPMARWDAQVPVSAPTGEYTLTIGVEDRMGKTSVEEEVDFRIRGRDIEPSDTLVVHNFKFYRSETSMQPMRPAVYRPGDTVWARFEITGYEFGEGNRFAVAYGIKVLRASGATLFEQPVAADEEQESFYPQRLVQGGLSLNLTKDLTPGEYTIVVTVTDKIGEQTYEETATFQVE